MIKRLKVVIKTLLNKYYIFNRLIIILSSLLWRWNLEINKFRKTKKIITKDNLYWVSPKKIEYGCLKEFDIYKYKNKIIDGNWDLLVQKIEEMDVYKAIKEVLVCGEVWQNTKFYQRVLQEISNGASKWGCRNENELRQRTKYIESLYKTIQKNGYMPKAKMSYNKKCKEDEITVNIDRNGNLLFNNGRHRLSIAKILNIDKVPIKITVRHKKWTDFKKEISAYAEKNAGKVYQTLMHIDLKDIPSHYGHERFYLIKKNILSQKGKLLDIGAQWGYYCHQFEKIGFDCYAIENNPKQLYFLKKLKKAGNKKFKIIPKSIFKSYNKLNKNFDVVLSLNIFHHFIKHKKSYYQLIQLLNHLKMKEMFFQAHKPNEPQMKNAFKNFSPENFASFILKNSCLKQKKCIGQTKDGRYIYHLY